jgi:hypothetical protein
VETKGVFVFLLYSYASVLQVYSCLQLSRKARPSCLHTCLHARMSHCESEACQLQPIQSLSSMLECLVEEGVRATGPEHMEVRFPCLRGRQTEHEYEAFESQVLYILNFFFDFLCLLHGHSITHSACATYLYYFPRSITASGP